MKVYLENGAFEPTRGHPMDAGLDLKAPYTFEVDPGKRKDIDTGVHVRLPTDTVGLVTSKLAVMHDKGVTSQGVIDASYRGSIHVILFNTSKEIAYFNVGDKIAQFVIVPCRIVDVEQVFKLDDLGHTDRGEMPWSSK